MEFRVRQLGVVDSTNERAFDALARGAARDGDVFVARGQTRGRGRRGASWHSAEGEGLYATVVLLPPAPLSAPATTMAAGVAVLEAVRELGLARASLEWPNDVVVGAAKLAGILVETRGMDPARPHYVLGIGLNVRQRAFPRELEVERAVTSLVREGIDVLVSRTLDALLAHLGPRLDEARVDPERACETYLERAGLLGRAARAEAPGGTLEGRIAGLSLARGLELELGGGVQCVALEHLRGLALV